MVCKESDRVVSSCMQQNDYEYLNTEDWSVPHVRGIYFDKRLHIF